MGEVYDKLTVLQTDASAIHPLYKPLDVNHKGDMSLQWKITKKGCATKKGNNMFCMCCHCLGKHMATPQTPRETCVLCPGNPPSPPVSESHCHHHAFDADELQKYKERANEIVALLETDLGDFNPDDHHFARHEPARADDGLTDLHSFNFEPHTVAECMEVCNKIEDDLMVGNLDTFCLLECFSLFTR
jgi:hypothetical protein